MPEIPNNEDIEKEPEKPLECTGECKRPISYHYTEIVGNTMTHYGMCSECPVLRRRLHGVNAEGKGTSSLGDAGLACGNCGTTLESIKVGTPLGCSNCYEVFDETIIAELQGAGKLPSRITSIKKPQPLHIGRVPGAINELTPSIKLLALNEALNETLKKEDYEQAALLRDQIQALTKEEKKSKNGETKKNGK